MEFKKTQRNDEINVTRIVVKENENTETSKVTAKDVKMEKGTEKFFRSVGELWLGRFLCQYQITRIRDQTKHVRHQTVLTDILSMTHVIIFCIIILVLNYFIY